jgi:hypothetical protein
MRSTSSPAQRLKALSRPLDRDLSKPSRPLDAKPAPCALLLSSAHLVDVEDLARGPLHLAHLVQEVPEPRPRHHLVRREQLHAVHLTSIKQG